MENSMTTKPYKCRAHNGIFRIEVRRGRPPVNCTEANPCDGTKPKRNRVVTKENTPTSAQKLAAHTGLRESQIVITKGAVKAPTFSTMPLPELRAYARTHFSTISKLTTRKELVPALEKAYAKKQTPTVTQPERVASAIKNRRTAVTEPVESPRKARAKAPEIDSEPRSQGNRSVEVAQAARAELEAVGWNSKGRGWTNGEDVYAELTANRGSETIVLTWCNGDLTGQDYSIWHSKPSRNAMPKRRLKFNPDEMTDGELIRAISGMKVTWWNSLAKSEESFTVGTKTLSIEHTFAANGDEDSAKRIVKFVDMNGGGFRHFHVDALLKVGQ